MVMVATGFARLEGDEIAGALVHGHVALLQHSTNKMRNKVPFINCGFFLIYVIRDCTCMVMSPSYSERTNKMKTREERLTY